MNNIVKEYSYDNEGKYIGVYNYATNLLKSKGFVNDCEESESLLLIVRQSQFMPPMQRNEELATAIYNYEHRNSPLDLLSLNVGDRIGDWFVSSIEKPVTFKYVEYGNATDDIIAKTLNGETFTIRIKGENKKISVGKKEFLSFRY